LSLVAVVLFEKRKQHILWLLGFVPWFGLVVPLVHSFLGVLLNLPSWELKGS
jgi:hypothetical protein